MQKPVLEYSRYQSGATVSSKVYSIAGNWESGVVGLIHFLCKKDNSKIEEIPKSINQKYWHTHKKEAVRGLWRHQRGINVCQNLLRSINVKQNLDRDVSLSFQDLIVLNWAQIDFWHAVKCKNEEKGISFCITKSYLGTPHCNPINSHCLIWTKTPLNVCATMRSDPILCILVLVGWAPARIHLTLGYYWESWYHGKAVPAWLPL